MEGKYFNHLLPRKVKTEDYIDALVNPSFAAISLTSTASPILHPSKSKSNIKVLEEDYRPCFPGLRECSVKNEEQVPLVLGDSSRVPKQSTVKAEPEVEIWEGGGIGRGGGCGVEKAKPQLTSNSQLNLVDTDIPEIKVEVMWEMDIDNAIVHGMFRDSSIVTPKQEQRQDQYNSPPIKAVKHENRENDTKTPIQKQEPRLGIQQEEQHQKSSYQPVIPPPTVSNPRITRMYQAFRV